MAKFCKNCGTELKEGKVCQNCGTVNEGATTAKAATKTSETKATTTTNTTVNTAPATTSSTNGFAIAGFVLSLVGLVCCSFVICGILGLIFSIIGLNKANSSNGNGKGLAIAGIIIGGVAILLTIIYWILVIVGYSSAYSYYKFY